MAKKSTIKELAKRGLSLRKVAALAKVSHTAVDRTIRGERCVSAYTRRKILRIIKHHPI